MVEIPDDILHLICAQLWEQRDFKTLFSCCLASKSLAVPAVQGLYRIYSTAAVSDFGNDELELPPNHNLKSDNLSNQSRAKQLAKLWATLWRSIILSSMGKTMMPYCRYIRVLDLRDLANLLEEDRYDGMVQNELLKGELVRLKLERIIPNTKKALQRKLRVKDIVAEVAEMVTNHCPAAEVFEGDLMPASVARFAQRLPQLKELNLWYGDALSDGGGVALRKNCPDFKDFSVYLWNSENADQEIATFLDSLSDRPLTSFRIIRRTELGPLGMEALPNHSKTLVTLQLCGIKSEAFAALEHLKDCTLLKDLELEAAQPSESLNHTKIISDTLSHLLKLERYKTKNIESSPTALIPLLLNPDVHLQFISISCESIGSDFYEALEHQGSLTALEILLASLDDDDCESFIESLSCLKQLDYLHLREISDEFTESNVQDLLRSLPGLKDLYIGAVETSDQIWEDLAKLKRLKQLTLAGETTFTADNIEAYISQLGTDNEGLVVTVMNQLPDYPVSDASKRRLNKLINTRVGGRFDLIYTRDPEGSETGSASE